MNKFGLQNYSLNEICKDVGIIKRLEKAKELGYTGVELCGISEISAKELREVAASLGLDIYSMHIGVNDFDDRMDEYFEYINELGLQFAVFPYAQLNTADDAAKLGERLGEYAEKAAMNGLRFCYHNHADEFKKTDDNEYFFDIIMQNASDLLEIEFDVGWIKHAGADPYEMLRRYSGRVPLIHVRQLNDDNRFCGLDIAGKIDLPSVKALADRFGVEGYIAEFAPEDVTEKEIRKSADYLRAL